MNLRGRGIASIASIVVLNGDLSVPQGVEGSFASGGVQEIVQPILPPGTTDPELSAEDAAKPVGTVVARATLSVIAWCADASRNPTALYVTPIEVSAATRPPKPADWPDDTFYDTLQWSWTAKSYGSGG